MDMTQTILVTGATGTVGNQVVKQLSNHTGNISIRAGGRSKENVKRVVNSDSVGHKYSRGLDVNYDRTSEDDRLQEYLKAMDLLTISPENRLRKEIHDKDQIINYKLQEKDDALTTLSDQVMKLMAEVQELKNRSHS